MLLTMALLIPNDLLYIKAGFYFVSYIIVGYDVVIRAVKSITRGNAFNENFLMSIATIGAFIIGEYPEAVAVMLFYQVGELFQSYAVQKSRRSITALMEIRPDYANLKEGDSAIKVDPDEVNVGDTIVVRPGERIPLDGIVVKGESLLDTSALTGESLPRATAVDSEVLSGCINLKGLLEVRVTSSFEESTINKILELVEEATANKAKTESFITKFARYYTPFVVVVAVLLAVVPPFVLRDATLVDWVYRALAFLVVSCPCALVISVPLSFFGGIGGASKEGILIKGGNYIESLAKAGVVIFDKTGTLTKGVFAVQKIEARGIDKGKLLELAAHVEFNSNHPISQSIVCAYGGQIEAARITRVEELAGHGMRAFIDGEEILVGNDKLMKAHAVDYSTVDEMGTAIHVASGAHYCGYLLIADEVKHDAAETISNLKLSGIDRTVMLTGDNESVGKQVGESLGLDEVHAELLPGEKLELVESIHEGIQANRSLVFVGDGINDAPALARADVGIAMGGLGSDAAIEAADVVIMNDEPSKVPTAIGISKKTLAIARENIVFALSIKAVVLVLAALGIATMWAAVFADVGVTIIAILNSFRALRYRS